MRQDPFQAAFSHLLISGTLVHEADFADLQRAYGMDIHPHFAMVVSIDRYPDLAAGQSIEWRQDVGHQLVDAVYGAVSRPFTWLWIEEGVLALLVELPETKSRPREFEALTVRMARDIQRASRAVGISVSIGIGTFYENPLDLHKSFKEATQSMSGRFFQGNQKVFQYGKEVNVGEIWDVPLTAEKTELLALVRIGDEQGVESHLRTLLDRMAEVCMHHEDLFKSEVVDLIMLMSRSVLESGISATAILAKNARFIHELYTTIRYDKFVLKVCEYAKWLTAQVGQSQTPRVSPVIRQAIRYLKQNHRSSLSLEEIARFCCLSKFHLSHLFKKEVGVGVIDFLNQLRIEKAIFYIRSTDLPVQQIAELVGFQDPNYFSRTFKKYTGRSPRQYRIAILCEQHTTPAR